MNHRPLFLALASALVALTAACAGHHLPVLGGGGGKHHRHKATPTLGNRVPILTHVETGASVDDSLAGVAVVLPPATENEAWAQPGGAPNKSYGNLAISAAPRKVWTIAIPGATERRRHVAAARPEITVRRCR